MTPERIENRHAQIEVYAGFFQLMKLFRLFPVIYQ